MVRGERTCSFRLCSMLGDDVGSFSSKPMTGRPSCRISIFRFYAELLGMDGEPFEFEWNILPPSLQILQKTQNDLQRRNIEHKNLEIVSSSCPCSTTSIGQRRESKRIVFQIQTKSRCTRRDSRKDIGRSLVLETQRSGMETATINLKENGIPLPHRWYNDS